MGGCRQIIEDAAVSPTVKRKKSSSKFVFYFCFHKWRKIYANIYIYINIYLHIYYICNICTIYTTYVMCYILYMRYICAYICIHWIFRLKQLAANMTLKHPSVSLLVSVLLVFYLKFLNVSLYLPAVCADDAGLRPAIRLGWMLRINSRVYYKYTSQPLPLNSDLIRLENFENILHKQYIFWEVLGFWRHFLFLFLLLNKCLTGIKVLGQILLVLRVWVLPIVIYIYYHIVLSLWCSWWPSPHPDTLFFNLCSYLKFEEKTLDVSF